MLKRTGYLFTASLFGVGLFYFREKNMADPMTQEADPMAAEPAEETGGDGGYCIEIRVGADGQIKVGVEALADEMSEESGESGDTDDEQYQAVGSIGEALRIVKDIYANAGQIEDAGAGQADMSAGYGKGM